MMTSANVSLRRQCTRGKAKLLIITSTILWFLIEVFIPIGFHVEQSSCIPSVDSLYLFMYQIMDLLCTAVPLLILVVFSLLTLNHILRRRIFARDDHQLAVQSLSRIVHERHTGRIANRRTIENADLHRKYTRRERQLVQLSFIQATAFIIFNIPSALYSLYAYITRLNTESVDFVAVNLLLNTIASNLAYTHCAVSYMLTHILERPVSPTIFPVTFYLYTLTSKEFRKQFCLACHEMQRKLIILLQPQKLFA